MTGGLLLVGISGVFSLPNAEAAGPPGTTQQPCWTYPPIDYWFGKWVSGWGYHAGEDVCHQEGIPMYAVADGTVVYSARTPDSYRWGNLIIIDHGYATTIYGHLGDNRQVGAGARVQKGQHIGYVGAQGPQNGYWGPHVHFGVKAGAYQGRIGTYAPYIRGYENNPPSNWVGPSEFTNSRRAAYDFLSYQEVSQRSVYYNDGMDVTVRLRNTGNQTWRKDGPNPMRLGTAGPRDRSSGFSQNGTARGWVSPSRIKMEADTPPDELATFSFRIESNQLPAFYDEQFEPVVEGVSWLGDRTIHIPFTLQPPGWRGQYVKQLVTSNSDPLSLTGIRSAEHLLPGEKINLKLIVKNTGELPWDAAGANPTRLGTNHPYDRGSVFATIGNTSIPPSENWLSGNRASGLDGRYEANSNTVVADSQITTGETGVFSFTITAPETPGTYREYFLPIVEGKTQMPDFGAYFDIQVADRGFHYQYVTQSQSTQSIGATGTNHIDATVQLRNTGREPWPVGGNLRLGTENPRDHASSVHSAAGPGAWIAPNRPATVGRNVSNGAKSSVDVGEVAEFSFRMNIGPNLGKGDYRLYVQPVAEGVAWLPEQAGIYFPFQITANASDQQVTHQSFAGGTPTNFPQGSQMTATLRIKNTGRTTWPVSGPNAVRLGTIRPHDRNSGFTTSGGSDPWLAPNRPSAIDGRYNVDGTTSVVTQIIPGETAIFNVPLTATPGPGLYNEYFNLVSEGVSWLPDYGIYFPLTVTAAPNPSPTPSPSSQPTTSTCDISLQTMTAPNCTPVTADTAAAADPLPLWKSIECDPTTRAQHLAAGGDPRSTASGQSQGNAAFRQLTVLDGDDFSGERCELGKNDHRNSNTFQLYKEGERRITMMSARLPDTFPLDTQDWQIVTQMKQTQPSNNGGGTPVLSLHASRGAWRLYQSNSVVDPVDSHELWSVPAQKNVWSRIAFDVTYSSDPAKGSVRILIDANGDGDMLDAGEQSPTFQTYTLKVETAGSDADGITAGSSIPSHLRIGIYQKTAIVCAAPNGCSIDYDNVQILKP